MTLAIDDLSETQLDVDYIRTDPGPLAFISSMPTQLRHYLIDAYKSPRNFYLPQKHIKTLAIQIDDQDDMDSMTDFCNIFCTVTSKNEFIIELNGKFPITQEIADLVEIYKGYTNQSDGKLIVKLHFLQIEVLKDLSDYLRKTSFMGDLVGNPNWTSVSARTISSLYRFIRIMKEYQTSGGSF
jgi:hypothetical protein